MAQRTAEISLADGKTIFCANRQEVEFLREEMPAYFRHGIAIREGDTVMDVGANIGLFSLYASLLSHGKANILAFEPITTTFEILQRNIQRHQLHNIKSFPVGLSRISHTATFSSYPHCTGWCTMYPDDSAAQRALMKRLALANSESAPSFLRWLRWLPRWICAALLERKINHAFISHQITCELKTISQIIREEDVKCIDLLKVDVERSELDVLLGIVQEHWPLIRQVVMEVHDLNGRLAAVVDLLRGQGFAQIVVEQHPFLRGYETHNLYALRSA